jgi:hypothetical protein
MQKLKWDIGAAALILTLGQVAPNIRIMRTL